MTDCLFCKIINGKIPSTQIYTDDNVIGFKDIQPQAPEHYLFIHKNHTRDILEMSDSDENEIAQVFSAITKFTRSNDLHKNGFRIITNCGKDAGQVVFHTHFHVMGGKKLGHLG